MTESLRQRLYQTPAIVLQVIDLAEADRIFVVFTPHYGKISVIAKGVRRTKSRLGPALDYFAEVSLNLTRGRQLDVVTAATPVDQHPRLRHDLEAYAYASHVAELVRDLTRERQEHPGVYELLASSLVLLDQGVDPWQVARHFELQALTLLGFRPAIFQCANCQHEITATPNAFSSTLGGMLCPDCSSIDPHSLVLSISAQKYLRTLERDGLSRVITLRIDNTVQSEVAQAFTTYLQTIVEHPMRSLAQLPALCVVSATEHGSASLSHAAPRPSKYR